ncbi:hypothetical protein [Nonomuraea sp. NPDC049400]|uniref:hypothetical protein n=1 Tax=Nonomuraea sp. NPDC049400 TaxID=3364352 RepID=UPI00378E6BAF
MNFCLSDLVPPLRWSDASTITLLTGQPDLPDAWWRSLPMPHVLTAIGPEALGELLTEIALEHWPAAAVGDVLPALYVLDPDEADEPAVAIALDRAGSWAGLLTLTSRELVDQPFIQARPVLNTLFSAALGRLAHPQVAEPAHPAPAGAHAAEPRAAVEPSHAAEEREQSADEAAHAAVAHGAAPEPIEAHEAAPEPVAAESAPEPVEEPDPVVRFAATGSVIDDPEPAAHFSPAGSVIDDPEPVASAAEEAAQHTAGTPEAAEVRHTAGTQEPAEPRHAAPVPEPAAAQHAADSPEPAEPRHAAAAPEPAAAPERDGAEHAVEAERPVHDEVAASHEGAPETGETGETGEGEPVADEPHEAAAHHEEAAALREEAAAHREGEPAVPESVLDADAEPVSDEGREPEPQPVLDAAEEPAPEPAAEEASALEAESAAEEAEPSEAPASQPEPAQAMAPEQEPAAAQELAAGQDPAPAQEPAPAHDPAAAQESTPEQEPAAAQESASVPEPAPVQEPVGQEQGLPELIEAAFAGLDDKSWAVAQNRVFTDEPSAVDQLAKLFAVPPAEISATEDEFRTRLDHWLASEEAAPYRAHLDELRETLGPAVRKEQLIGAADWHNVEIRALEVPAWQFVLATLAPRREPQLQLQPQSAFGQVQVQSPPPGPPQFQAFAPAAPAPEEANGNSGEHEPHQPPKDVSQTMRCFRQPDGRWWLRIDVTAEQLAGGECALPTGFASYLGLSPGESRTVRSAAGELTMAWHGRPVLESIERLLVDVGAREGGHLFLTLSDEGVLRARHLPVAAQGAEKITKALRLVGYTAPGGTRDQAARVIATRIGMTGPVALPDLLTRLRERGDRDLLELLD